MTRYQQDVLVYFCYQNKRFIHWTSTQKSETELIFADFTPIAIRFLDEVLREERKLYVPQCDRYSQLTDMLIEIHIAHGTEFIDRLNATAKASFLGNAATDN